MSNRKKVNKSRLNIPLEFCKGDVISKRGRWCIYQNRKRDESKTQEEFDMWTYHIIETQKGLAKLQLAYCELESLLLQYTPLAFSDLLKYQLSDIYPGVASTNLIERTVCIYSLAS